MQQAEPRSVRRSSSNNDTICGSRRIHGEYLAPSRIRSRCRLHHYILVKKISPLRHQRTTPSRRQVRLTKVKHPKCMWRSCDAERRWISKSVRLKYRYCLRVFTVDLRDLDLDVASGHTACRHVSLIYLNIKLRSNRNFLWTNWSTDIETGFIRSCTRVMRVILQLRLAALIARLLHLPCVHCSLILATKTCESTSH